MINLYRKNEVNFKHNQFVLNECKTCDITEEINSTYEITLEYPLNDSKDIAKEFVNEAFVKVPSYDDREPQLFVIRRAKPNIENNIVNCYAQAISFAKLDNNVVLDVNVVGKTRKQATQQLLSGTINQHRFIVGNNDTNATTKDIRVLRYSALTALKGDKNSILTTYGGELIPNNFTIDFVDQRGKDNGITVSYAKNITGAELTLEDIEKITEIIPVGSNDLMLPEKSVKAYNFDSNNPFTKVIEFNDIAVVDAEYDENGNCTNSDKVCTQEQAYELLRQACRDKFNIEKVNEVKFNLTLNFIELADCIDFEGNDYSEIQSKRVAIGDTIKVNIKPLNVNLKGRIYKITRDAITGRLKSAEIGYKKSNIISTINQAKQNIAATNKKVDITKKELKEDINKKTSDLETKMEKSDSDILLEVRNNKRDTDTKIEVADANILLEVRNNKSNTDTAIQLLDGEIDQRVTIGEFGTYRTQTAAEISEKVTNSVFSSYRSETANKIDQKVSRGNDFYTQIEESSDAIIETIHGATENKMILNSNGLRVVRGGFVFEDNNGDEILKAYASGGIQIGDDGWSQSYAMEHIYFGRKQLINYFMLSNININDELQMNGYNIYTDGTIYTVDLEVTGSKHCMQYTKNYGKRLINAYETADYYFGDIGSGKIENGECLIAIEPIFQECVNTDIEYHVFTQVYNGSISKIERYPNYFIVHGEEDTMFSWELKAKRKGFEANRLEVSKN